MEYTMPTNNLLPTCRSVTDHRPKQLAGAQGQDREMKPSVNESRLPSFRSGTSKRNKDMGLKVGNR